MPGFYCKSESIDDIDNNTVSRVLDQMGVENGLCKRWS